MGREDACVVELGGRMEGMEDPYGVVCLFMMLLRCFVFFDFMESNRFLPKGSAHISHQYCILA